MSNVLFFQVAILLTFSLGCVDSLQSSLQKTVIQPNGRSEAAMATASTPSPSATLNTDLPVFETTPDALTASADAAIARADSRISVIVNRPNGEMTFENTIAALDDLIHEMSSTLSRIYLIQNVSPSAEMRDRASDLVVKLETWLIGFSFRRDLFEKLKTFKSLNPNIESSETLSSEDKRFYSKLWTDYKRTGMMIEDSSTRDRVKSLKEKLSQLTTDFDENIRNAKPILSFTADDLVGVPVDFLNALPQENGKFLVNANVTTEYLTVAQNASNEQTRKLLETARQSIAMDKNPALLSEILATRAEIANLLGYASHADYQIEERMAKTAGQALSFLKNLSLGLEPKFQKELEVLKALKAEETGVANPDFHLWDVRYFISKLMREKYSVDTEQLRVFFEINRVIRGVFDIYEELFGLKIFKIQNPYEWAEGVELYQVNDSETNEVMGYFYLDNFPREGKYNHFAQFGIIDSKKDAAGNRVKPVVALVCNFPKATATTPALMRHSDVETFFHEFGHGMHSILTQTKYAKFAGTSVERDFVESPSQVLEAWAWDVNVLNRFAADYRDESVKIDANLLARMKEADLATKGLFYRRQIVFGKTDLELHMGAREDAATVGRQAFETIYFALPEGTDYTASFGHLTGYDAGYYGYAWADAISQDLLTAFRSAPGGLMDQEMGRKLRNEIYAVGGTRDAEESVRAFLGRDWSINPFLKSLGIEATP